MPKANSAAAMSPFRAPTDEESERKKEKDWERIYGLREDVARIGEEIKLSRTRKGRTLQELSELIGQQNPTGSTITPSQLSKIERGQVNPAISDLKLISLALEVELKDLIDWSPKPWFVVRKDQVNQRVLDLRDRLLSVSKTQGWHERQVEQGIYYYVPLEAYEEGLLLPEDRSGTMAKTFLRASMIWISAANPERTVIEQALETHRGEELVFVLSGKISFWHGTPEGKLAGEPVILGPWDCLRFSSQLPHVFFASAGSDEEAVMLHVFSDPLSTEPTVTTRSPRR